MEKPSLSSVRSIACMQNGSVSNKSLRMGSECLLRISHCSNDGFFHAGWQTRGDIFLCSRYTLASSIAVKGMIVDQEDKDRPRGSPPSAVAVFRLRFPREMSSCVARAKSSPCLNQKQKGEWGLRKQGREVVCHLLVLRIHGNASLHRHR